MQDLKKQTRSLAYERQKPLIQSYLTHPEKAIITDEASIEGKHLEDPFHTEVTLNATTQNRLEVGLHQAVGGLHDVCNPGDILCAALASCLESTLRMVASRMHIPLTKTRVRVWAELDVRGTLMIDTSVPVGFQKMRIDCSFEVGAEVDHAKKELLFQTAKHCCVVYQTIKDAIPMEMEVQY